MSCVAGSATDIVKNLPQRQILVFCASFATFRDLQPLYFIACVPMIHVWQLHTSH